MITPVRLTAIIEREEDGFVSLCPELDIASQGSSVEDAKANLVEALTLFFETAGPSEAARRFHSDIFITQKRGRLFRERGGTGPQ
jgi:predicted RNase H-like HicB family nuclease